MRLSSNIPLFEQIRKALHERIAVGLYRPDQALPNELQFAEEFGVAAGTVRKALDLLEAQGYLIRRQGRGTFVQPHKTWDELSLNAKAVLSLLKNPAPDRDPAGLLSVEGLRRMSAGALEIALWIECEQARGKDVQTRPDVPHPNDMARHDIH